MHVDYILDKTTPFWVSKPPQRLLSNIHNRGENEGESVSYRKRWTVIFFNPTWFSLIIILTAIESPHYSWRPKLGGSSLSHHTLLTRSNMLTLWPVSNIWTLPFFLTMGRDLCPTVVLWLRRETDTRHAHTHWSNISLSSIRVMDLLLEERHQSLGVFSLNLISRGWVILSTASAWRLFMFSDSIHPETARDEKLSRTLSFTNERPFSIFLPTT